MAEDPFLARLQAHANALKVHPPEPAAEEPAAEEPSADEPSAASAPSAVPSPTSDQTVARSMLAFWQHPVARSYIRRRITGPAVEDPIDLVAEAAAGIPTGLAISLRMTDPSFEATLLERGICREVVALDDDAGRLEAAQNRIPAEARDRVRCMQGDLDSFDPCEPATIAVARSVLHRQREPEALLKTIRSRMAPGGLLHVDEFVGPALHQWTDQQIAIVNRLLQALPRELREDLTASDGRRKDNIGRPDPEAFAAAHPGEAIGSDRIVAALDRHFERVVFRPYGGALFHQLFARIMGNFASRGDVVRLVMEFDGILTDYGVLDSDYLWAVYRRS
jgi:SAM-dependent methyltransferase